MNSHIDQKEIGETALPERVLIGGIPSSRATRKGLVDLMVADSYASRRGILNEPRILIASNGSTIAAFHQRAEFKDLVLQADVIDVDGMPLVLASRLFCKRPLTERIATTDFIEDAARVASRSGIRFYFLGGRPGVAAKAAEILRHQYPGLEIVGTRSGYFSPDEAVSICKEIVDAGTDILWLGLGSPLQERFAVKNREHLNGIAWIRTCGGLFDHCIGYTRRAPRWMQSIGLEWLVRMIQEPRRLGRRYLLSNPVALYHLVTKTRD